MSQEKYIGMDVHQATISVAVLDSPGQVNHGKYSGDESGHDQPQDRWDQPGYS